MSRRIRFLTECVALLWKGHEAKIAGDMVVAAIYARGAWLYAKLAMQEEKKPK